ncbi:hypothetical protein F2P56_011617 [Juglans regia]|uniref:Disease resistance protein At3g14460 n=1 Tax=Juglans regia TaxID=51240 RepID=A0A834D1B7_JUGRE|nr:hypothetical protein F2P56_011617 [Juglans regia]
MLTGNLPIHLPSLGILEIIDCPEMQASLPKASTICQLKLRNCREDILRELPIHVTKKLTIGGFDSVFMGGLPSTLKTLKIMNCTKLGLPTNLYYPCLEILKLFGCGSLQSFPMDLFLNVKDLTILNCSNLKSITVAESVTVALSSLSISYCESLILLPDKMDMLLPSLTRFLIKECTNIKRLPEGGLPSSLNDFMIRNCEKLVESRMGWSLQNLASLRYLTIEGGSKDVVSFPEKGLLPTNLISLEISEFPNLTSFDSNGFENLTSLTNLSVSNCQKLERMPEEGLQHLTSLEGLVIQSCPKLECMLEEGLQHLTSLSVLLIIDCPLLMKRRWKRKAKEWRRKLECMLEAGLQHLTSLSSLLIIDCPLLMKRWRKRRKAKEWCKLAHIPIKKVDGELIE